MKIALMGANGTGKTTLAIKLHEVLGKESFRLVAYSRPTLAARALGYNSAREVPDDPMKQFYFQYECLLQQIRAQQIGGTNYIIDRSTVDPLAFLNYKLPFMKGTTHHDMYVKLAHQFCKYDFLFFVPNFGGEIEDNGVRLMIKQEPVEREILAILDNWKVPFYTVKSKSVNNRVAEVCEVLKV